MNDTPHLLRRIIDAVQTPVVLIALVGIVTAVALGADSILERVLTGAVVSVVFVVGLSIYAGNAGMMSFGHVAFMALGAYTTAYLTIPSTLKSTFFPEMPGPLRFLLEVSAPYPIALVLSGLVAAVLGLLLAPSMSRLSSLPFGIATLAVLVISYTILSSWTSVTRGTSSVIGIPDAVGPGWAFIGAVIAIGLAWAYKCSRSGLQLQSSREDELAARASGVAVGRHRGIAWVLSAFVCGLAGSLYAGYLTTFSANAFYLTLTFGFVVMIVVGGYLSLSGAVLGALGISLLREVLRRFQDGQFTGGSSLPPGTSDLVMSAVVLLVLVKAPLGVMRTRELRFRLSRAPRPDITNQAAPAAELEGTSR